MTMVGLSKLDQMLDVEPITSIEGFKSQNAQMLAARFGLTLAELPGLRRALHDSLSGLERQVEAGKIQRGYAARMLAAEAMFYYEKSARGKDFKLVIPGQTSFSDGLYDHVTGVNPNAARADATFGNMYATKAFEYSS